MSPPPAVTDAAGLPDSLKSTAPLWEVRHGGSVRKSSSCTRLYDDGSLYSWSDTRRVLVNGLPSRKEAGFAWRLDARISAKGVAQVQELIQSGFVQLAPPAVKSLGADQALTVWRSCLKGASHEVALADAATSSLPAAIRDIDRAIQGSIVPGAVPMEQQR